MPSRFVSYEKACEFSLGGLLATGGKSGLVCLSHSTWILAYSLVTFYGYWRSRYYVEDELDGLVQLTDEQWEGVTDIVDLAIKELSMTGCEELVVALSDISQSLAVMAEAAEVGAVAARAAGQSTDDAASDGQVSIGGARDKYQTQAEYFDEKCSVANAIYDTLYAFATGDISNFSAYVGIGGELAIVASLLVASGPAGWTVGAVTLAVAGITFLLLSASISFSDIATALSQQHEEIVTAMFNASDTVTARASVLAALGDATQALTSAEVKVVTALLTNKMLNQLFSPDDELGAYQSSNPVDCGSFVTQVWTFDTGFQSWTFEDRSTGSSTASREWDEPNESIKTTLVVASEPNVSGIGVNISPTLAIPVSPGGAIQCDFGDVSDGIVQRFTLRAIYDDLSSYETSVVTADNGVLTLDITVSGTLEVIEWECGRSTSGSALGSTNSSQFFECRVYGG